MSRVIDFDKVVELLNESNINAYVEQTGGGCATIYAGLSTLDGEWECAIGPGYFAGPNWTQGRGNTADLVVGPDDDEGEYEIAPEDADEEYVAIMALEYVKW